MGEPLNNVPNAKVVFMIEESRLFFIILYMIFTVEAVIPHLFNERGLLFIALIRHLLSLECAPPRELFARLPDF